jgi:hypothetical protein
MKTAKNFIKIIAIGTVIAIGFASCGGNKSSDS